MGGSGLTGFNAGTNIATTVKRLRVCICVFVCGRRAVNLAFELGRERNPSVVAHDRRSKLAKSRVEVGEKMKEFNHWATEADKHIEHKVK